MKTDNIMPEKIQLNHFYRLHQNRIIEIDFCPLSNNCSKLNVFNNNGLKDNLEVILAVLKNFPEQVIVCPQQKDAGFHWSLFADYSTLQSLLIKLNELSVELQFDYLLWPEKIIAAPKLMLFDMDSTFIEIEVIDELAKRHNVGDKVSQVTEAAMRGELDFAESLISRVSCLKGLDESVIENIAKNLPLSEGVLDLVTVGKNNGCKTAIVSGGFTPFAEFLKTDLDLFDVRANQLEIVDGELTGKIRGDIVDAQAKADFLFALCQQLAISADSVIAIGDGANDLLMMKAAGFNLAYYAKPSVQREARGRMNHSTLARLIDLFDW